MIKRCIKCLVYYTEQFLNIQFALPCIAVVYNDKRHLFYGKACIGDHIVLVCKIIKIDILDKCAALDLIQFLPAISMPEQIGQTETILI